MKSPVIKSLQSLPEGQSFRIDWFGNVAHFNSVRHSQPFVNVVLSEIAGDGEWTYPEKFESPIQQHSKWVPIGYLPLIRIGDIWQDGSLLLQPDYTVEKMKLRIHPDCAKIIKSGVSREENADFILPFDRHPYHKGHTNSYCIMVESGTTSLIIPSLELIRFYFGSSSNLLARLFTVPFDENNLWTSIKKDVDGIAEVGLAHGISGYSAADVARIALDSATWRAARITGESCMAATAMKEKAYPKAVFPFTGETELMVSGIWLDENKETFLAFRILSCSHPFPFVSLHYTMARKPVTMDLNSEDSEKKDGKSRTSRGGAKEKNMPLDDREPFKNLGSKRVPVKREVRFPDLIPKPILRIDPIKPVTIFCSGDSPKIESWSTGEDGTEAGIRPIELVDANRAPLPVWHPLFHTPYWKMLSDLVESLKKEYSIVQFVPLDPRQPYPQFSLMPRAVNEDGEIHPLCLIEDQGKTRARYVSVLKYAEESRGGVLFFPETDREYETFLESSQIYMLHGPSARPCSITWYFDIMHHALWDSDQAGHWLSLSDTDQFLTSL